MTDERTEEERASMDDALAAYRRDKAEAEMWRGVCKVCGRQIDEGLVICKWCDLGLMERS